VEYHCRNNPLLQATYPSREKQHNHIRHLEATQLPLWYVRWTDYNCRKPIDLIQLAFDDHPEQWGRGYAYVRAVDEMGAYAAAVARKRKKAI
jgi:hypothetical protein